MTKSKALTKQRIETMRVAYVAARSRMGVHQALAYVAAWEGLTSARVAELLGFEPKYGRE